MAFRLVLGNCLKHPNLPSNVNFLLIVDCLTLLSSNHWHSYALAQRPFVSTTSGIWEISTFLKGWGQEHLPWVMNFSFCCFAPKYFTLKKQPWFSIVIDDMLQKYHTVWVLTFHLRLVIEQFHHWQFFVLWPRRSDILMKGIETTWTCEGERLSWLFSNWNFICFIVRTPDPPDEECFQCECSCFSRQGKL